MVLFDVEERHENVRVLADTTHEVLDVDEKRETRRLAVRVSVRQLKMLNFSCSWGGGSTLHTIGIRPKLNCH